MASVLDPLGGGLPRYQKIVESLRQEIVQGCEGAELQIRIRQVFFTPREIYRIELEVPQMSYLRTTLLDRDALEDLLETPGIRDLLSQPAGDEPCLSPEFDELVQPCGGPAGRHVPAARRQFEVAGRQVVKSSAGEATK